VIIRALPVAAALAAVAIAGIGGWRVGVQGSLLRVKEIRFAGLHRATVDELIELSPVRTGDHLFLLDPDAMEAGLRRHPWVARAEVRRRWPPALEVTVEERTPAALADLGGLYLVDKGGVVFKRAAPGDGLDLPLVTGLGREDWEERRGELEPLLAGALALLARWPASGLPARRAVSEVHVDRDAGLTVFTMDGTELRLGDGDLDGKLVRAAKVLSALDAEGQRAEVLHLDNRRRPDWIAVRLRRGRSPEEATP
jgi:cell division protein FtsQ